MNIIGKLSVLPTIPAPLARLYDLAHNLWWSWETDAQSLYERLDPELWGACNHNPLMLLQSVAQESLDNAARDPDYLDAYQRVIDEFDHYMDPNADTWFKAQAEGSGSSELQIAYFSAEFGLHEALPIYSGGLGILSGDHCKAASDLGLPFIGIGFLYPQGYFNQRIDLHGQQQADYVKIDFAQVPATPALDHNGNEILINVDLPGRTVYAKIWQIQVGRISIYLMDTDVERNAPQDRELSARLYGGDREMRISQEVVLGIGGVRAVNALGFKPTVWHMNEGHSAFLNLERIRELVQTQGLTFGEAVEAVRTNTLFTTHTPVPAGNDAFGFELIDKFFWQFWGQIGLDREEFINVARQELAWGPQYSMTVLALRLSAYHNGVSKLHGEVSRGMWQFLWPDTPAGEIPIGHITNGVHTKTWLADELRKLYSQYLGTDWLDQVETSATWENINAIPDEELWSVHQLRKEKLVMLARARLRTQYLRHGEGPQRIGMTDHVLNANTLTIGFARRFATYKRAMLLFRDLERVKRILNDPERQVQIVFSGKAHPADEPGKTLIRQIYELSQEPDFQGKIVFLENYDMNIARHMVAGVDVWLNTPRRPREASGTSGQKAALCGVPNCSILDGWWAEGYNGENGWAIGEDREYKDEDTQDEADAYSLYQLLEDEIIPSYYQRDESGIPRRWLHIMKESIYSCAPVFSMRRMVIDYTQDYYQPAAQTGAHYHGENYALSRTMAAWKSAIRSQWHGVSINASPIDATMLHVGESVPIQARAYLNNVSPGDIAVDLACGELDLGGQFANPEIVPLQAGNHEDGNQLYQGDFLPNRSGNVALGVRIRPHNPNLIHPYEMGLMRWA